MLQKFTTPKNTKIKISELGEERTFVSGNKNWRLDWAEFKGVKFEPGMKVSWFCEDDNKTYRGKIEWIILIDDGSVEVSIDNGSIGRLPLEELELTARKKQSLKK